MVEPEKSFMEMLRGGHLPDVISVYNDKGIEIKFHPLVSFPPREGKTYVVLKPILPIKGMEDADVDEDYVEICYIDEDHDMLVPETDDEIREDVYDVFVEIMDAREFVRLKELNNKRGLN
ncbi:MAG: hypothetical protein LUD47_04355 [Clostridia bacterium]|nr:hypothetical protein [Clostridia bacterium]